MVKIVKSIQFSFFFFYHASGKTRTSKRSSPQFSTVADIVRASTFGSESRRRRKKGGEEEGSRGVRVVHHSLKRRNAR